ncbi:MAG: AbrB/MazE/SpoVT family DNA-binding domain-containing protein [Desulfofustis sp.]|nr:AbrB/MazE/SpoVT family DNA-binding domain-containing protein [Desulfofustis sp.]
MKTSIIKIGNSQGVRIPKPILDQCGFEKEVELVIQGQTLLIRSKREPRTGWGHSFQKMAACQDDQLLDSVTSEWDEEEWEWE